MDNRFDNVSLCMQPDCGHKMGGLKLDENGGMKMKQAINNFNLYDCEKYKNENGDIEQYNKCVNNLYTISNKGQPTIHNAGKVGVHSNLYADSFNRKYNKVFVNCPDGKIPYDTVQFNITNTADDSDGPHLVDGNLNAVGMCVKDSNESGDIEEVCKMSGDPIGATNNQYASTYEDSTGNTPANCSNIDKIYLTNSVDNENETNEYLVNTPGPTEYTNFKNCQSWCEKDINCAGVQQYIDEQGNVFCKYYNGQNENVRNKLNDDKNYITYNNVDTYVKNEHPYSASPVVKEPFINTDDGLKMILSLLIIACIIYLICKKK